MVDIDIFAVVQALRRISGVFILSGHSDCGFKFVEVGVVLVVDVTCGLGW
jgi:hypothetical protein